MKSPILARRQCRAQLEVTLKVSLIGKPQIQRQIIEADRVSSQSRPRLLDPLIQLKRMRCLPVKTLEAANQLVAVELRSLRQLIELQIAAKPIHDQLPRPQQSALVQGICAFLLAGKQGLQQVYQSTFRLQRPVAALQAGKQAIEPGTRAGSTNVRETAIIGAAAKSLTLQRTQPAGINKQHPVGPLTRCRITGMHLTRIYRDQAAHTNAFKTLTVTVRRMAPINDAKGKLIVGVGLIAGTGTTGLAQLNQRQRRTALEKLLLQHAHLIPVTATKSTRRSAPATAPSTG